MHSPALTLAVDPCPLAPDADAPMGYCASCGQNVFDARASSRSEVDRARLHRGGRLCVELWTDEDGAVVFGSPDEKPRPRRPLRGRLVPRPEAPPEEDSPPPRERREPPCDLV